MSFELIRDNPDHRTNFSILPFCPLTRRKANLQSSQVGNLLRNFWGSFIVNDTRLDPKLVALVRLALVDAHHLRRMQTVQLPAAVFSPRQQPARHLQLMFHAELVVKAGKETLTDS